jgi:kynurenine formamidase
MRAIEAPVIYCEGSVTNLSELPPSGFFLHAVPVKIAGVAAFPVRAYAVL